MLSFAHRVFAQTDDGYAVTTTGWRNYLVSLQQYLETVRPVGMSILHSLFAERVSGLVAERILWQMCMRAVLSSGDGLAILCKCAGENILLRICGFGVMV